MKTGDRILEAIKIIAFIVVVIASIILIIMLVMKLTEHSPTELTVIMWIAGIMFTLLFMIIMILFQIKGDVGGLKEFRRQMIEFQRQTISKIEEMKNKI